MSDHNVFHFKFIYPKEEEIKDKILAIKGIDGRNELKFNLNFIDIAPYSFMINGITFLPHSVGLCLVDIKKQDDGSFTANL